MSSRKNILILIGFVLSAALIASAITATLMTHFYGRWQFKVLGDVSGEIVEEQPDALLTVLSVLKDYREHSGDGSKENILTALGYRRSDFFHPKSSILFAFAGFFFGGSLFLFTVCYRRRKDIMRIRSLSGYLERVNRGGPVLLFQPEEDDFSLLQDEIYKTVTYAYQTKEAALEARNNFAENLSNIAHQIKTPITALSLTAQMMKEHVPGEYPEQILRQLCRLTHLEEALLLLSRIDAGAFLLEQKEVDVFTVLMLAADHLQEISYHSGVFFDIPELGEISITADMEWTMEAVMNLFKNCMEHTPDGGTVHCSYGQNPLYTEITIWDEGPGFEKEDLPHLFCRYYRGKNAGKGGIGLGLALAKELIEKQNGTIRAGNMQSGGARFEIRFYSH